MLTSASIQVGEMNTLIRLFATEGFPFTLSTEGRVLVSSILLRRRVTMRDGQRTLTSAHADAVIEIKWDKLIPVVFGLKMLANLSGLVALAALSFVSYAAPPQPPSGMAQEILAAHNRMRQGVHVPPLSWSDPLARKAQLWADHLLKTGKFEHQPRTQYGENLFEIRGPGAQVTPEEVVRDWAAEQADYDYRSNRCRGICGHYTQIVWRSTRQLGCAFSRSDRREVWVCVYDPPGNIVGQKPY